MGEMGYSFHLVLINVSIKSQQWQGRSSGYNGELGGELGWADGERKDQVHLS